MTALLVLVLLLGCQAGIRNISYSGGDGASVDRAVMIHGVRDMSGVIRAEDHWIRSRYGKAIIQRREAGCDPLTSDHLNPCDLVEFVTAAGETRVVYFAYPRACVPGQSAGTGK